ncbi:MAG: 4'-phosphopantetheinyl transferase superfamily protein [Lachnospiraceae bacterium]|nr:4'-phosphopantetheinyl transferase superfamily protein [Lachnospiraceae bacterium]
MAKGRQQQQQSQLQHEVGQTLLRYALKKEYDIELDKCTILKNKQGKPYLEDYPDVHYNISHCATMVVCTLGETPVGIDVEKKRPLKESLWRKVLTENELDKLMACAEEERNIEFLKYWTLKEAYGKALGVGLLYDYSKTDINSIEGYRFHQMMIGEDIIVSVCREQSEAYEEEIIFVENI